MEQSNKFLAAALCACNRFNQRRVGKKCSAMMAVVGAPCPENFHMRMHMEVLSVVYMRQETFEQSRPISIDKRSFFFFFLFFFCRNLCRMGNYSRTERDETWKMDGRIYVRALCRRSSSFCISLSSVCNAGGLKNKTKRRSRSRNVRYATGINVMGLSVVAHI